MHLRPYMIGLRQALAEPVLMISLYALRSGKVLFVLMNQRQMIALS